MRAGGQILVDQLELNGADVAFCLPGESFLPVLDALHDSSIRLVSCRHEQGAANAAEAYGKLTGRPGICLVTVKSGTQAAGLPGTIVFDASPQVPKAGEAFRISVFLSNEGSQPIPLSAMTVTTTLDGRPQRGPVPPLTSTVAPGQRGLLLQVSGQVWRENTQSWSMEIALTTQRGETYRNSLIWK